MSGYFDIIRKFLLNIAIKIANKSRNTTDAENEDQSVDKTKHFVSQVSYERFKELLTEAERITEGGYYYSLDVLIEYFVLNDMSYDETMEEYNHTVNDEKISVPFAQLFCDYMGLALGLYPIFIVVLMWLIDRTSNTIELIYSRKVSSVKLVLSRYLASITIALIPVFLLSLESLIPLISFGSENNCEAIKSYRRDLKRFVRTDFCS